MIDAFNSEAMGRVEWLKCRASAMRYLYFLGRDGLTVEEVWRAYADAFQCAASLPPDDVRLLDVAIDRAVFSYEAERDIVGAQQIIAEAMRPLASGQALMLASRLRVLLLRRLLCWV